MEGAAENLNMGPYFFKAPTNVNQNIGEANKAAPILWQAISPFVFHPDALTFLPIVPTGKYEWPDLPDCEETAHMA